MKVYACFITYRPEQERFGKALESVSSQVDKVIVVDNTAHNEGIARALNKAFEQAEAEGCDWLITFDQDSIAPEGLVKRLLDDINGTDNVGQIGPSYTNFKTKRSGVVEVNHLITSGSLTSVSAWRKTGGFREDYFIDYVDTEFSLHLRALDYKVLMDTETSLDHRLGEGLVGWNICGKKRLGFVDHVPVRWYYIVRNCCCLCKEYKTMFPGFTASRKRVVIRSVLRMAINGKDRMPRLKMVWKGWRDYRNCKTGPTDE